MNGTTPSKSGETKEYKAWKIEQSARKVTACSKKSSFCWEEQESEVATVTSGKFITEGATLKGGKFRGSDVSHGRPIQDNWKYVSTDLQYLSLHQLLRYPSSVDPILPVVEAGRPLRFPSLYGRSSQHVSHTTAPTARSIAQRRPCCI